MMCRLAVLCVAIFAVFIQVQGLNNDDVPKVGNDAEKYLKKLEEAVDKAMVQAQKALDDATNKINATAQGIEAAAEQDMQTSEAKFQEQLDALKAKAADAGVNIDDCLTGNEDTLVNLPNVLTDDMVHCANDKIIDGVSYAQEALNKLQTIVNEVENIRQEIKDCGGGIKGAKCLAKLAVKIEKDITSLPTEIEKDAAATVLLIAQLEGKVKDCASSRVDQCNSQGAEILATIGACVDSKIGA